MAKYTLEQFRSIFQNRFNREAWKAIVVDIFGANKVRRENELFTDPDEPEIGYYMGTIDTPDHYSIGLFYYKINTGSVAHKKVGLRNLVKRFINQNWGEFDAAIVVFDDGTEWRLSFVCDIKEEATAPKRFTFVFGEHDNYYRTAIERFNLLQGEQPTFENIRKAFSVEALSDDFFDTYRNMYADFVQYLTGKRYVKEGSKWIERELSNPNYQFEVSFEGNEKLVRDYVKKMFGRLVFLYFLQRKGWLAGNRQYMHDLFALSDKKENFLDGVLEPLFFDVLNTDKRYRTEAAKALPGSDNIPYLNGGLFARDDNDALNCVFPAEYFGRLFDFLDSYNFTIDENDTDDAEVGIDPEMLGRIFENLLEDNKDKGAFYTPKEIVDYMCRESIIAYLLNGEPERSHQLIRKFVETIDASDLNADQRRYIRKKLQAVKICDPAIGSGAFPMGLVNLLSKLYVAMKSDTDTAKMKRHIMEQNIYGVDIEKGAVDIARLRFWLAMIVEEKEPIPLPNLHFKIMQGNSLLESYNGIDLSDLTKVSGQSSLFDSENSERESLVASLKKYYKTSDHQERDRLFNEITNNVRRQLFDKGVTLPAGFDPSANTDFFLWHTWFSDIFANGGFDIVIGNPPYVSAVNMARTDEEKLLYKQLYPEATGAYDMYVLFLLLGAILSSNIYCWIIPNKLLVADYAKKTLLKLKTECGLEKTIDVSIYDIFKNASVYPIIVLGNKVSPVQFNSYYLDNYNDLIENKLNIKESINESHKIRLYQLGLKVCSGATGFEAQKIKENVCEIENNHTIPFTVSGNIDRYVFNNTNVRYMKDKYSRAYIYLDSNITESKQKMWMNPKIVIAGMTKQIEACYVDTPLAIGVGVYAIYDFTGYDPFYILAILNSKSTTDYLIAEFSDKHLAGGYLAINKSTIENFLFPRSVPTDIQQQLANIAKAIHLAKKGDPRSDTSALESQIDAIVTHLHSL